MSACDVIPRHIEVSMATTKSVVDAETPAPRPVIDDDDELFLTSLTLTSPPREEEFLAPMTSSLSSSPSSSSSLVASGFLSTTTTTSSTILGVESTEKIGAAFSLDADELMTPPTSFPVAGDDDFLMADVSSSGAVEVGDFPSATPEAAEAASKGAKAPRTGVKRKNSDSFDDSGYSDSDSGCSSDDSNSTLSESAPSSPQDAASSWGPPRPSPAYSEQRRLVFNMSMCKLQVCHATMEKHLRRSVLICNTLRRIEQEFIEDGVPVNQSSNSPPQPKNLASFSGAAAGASLADLDPPPSPPVAANNSNAADPAATANPAAVAADGAKLVSNHGKDLVLPPVSTVSSSSSSSDIDAFDFDLPEVEVSASNVEPFVHSVDAALAPASSSESAASLVSTTTTNTNFAHPPLSSAPETVSDAASAAAAPRLTPMPSSEQSLISSSSSSSSSSSTSPSCTQSAFAFFCGAEKTHGESTESGAAASAASSNAAVRPSKGSFVQDSSHSIPYDSSGFSTTFSPHAPLRPDPFSSFPSSSGSFRPPPLSSLLSPLKGCSSSSNSLQEPNSFRTCSPSFPHSSSSFSYPSSSFPSSTSFRPDSPFPSFDPLPTGDHSRLASTDFGMSFDPTQLQHLQQEHQLRATASEQRRFRDADLSSASGWNSSSGAPSNHASSYHLPRPNSWHQQQPQPQHSTQLSPTPSPFHHQPGQPHQHLHQPNQPGSSVYLSSSTTSTNFYRTTPYSDEVQSFYNSFL